MTRPRTLRDHLIRAALRVGVAWSALVLAAFVLVLLPLNMRVA
jgi:hypothetical protein